MNQLLTDEEISQLRAQSGLHCGERFLENLGDEFAEFAISFEQAVLAKLGAQEPVAQVVSQGRYEFPHLEWLSANHSFETPFGTKLYAAPPIPAGMALDAARYQWLQESGSHWILVDNETERLLQYPSNYDWPNTLRSAIDAAMLAARSKETE
jgi:hypothetical protein